MATMYPVWHPVGCYIFLSEMLNNRLDESRFPVHSRFFVADLWTHLLVLPLDGTTGRAGVSL